MEIELLKGLCSLWLGGLLVAVSTVGMAQEPEGPEEIIVVGSRTRSVSAMAAPVPVDLVTDSALAGSGAVAAELGQALATLVPSFNFPRQSNSGTSDLVRAGQLRGMSPDQMLVLVNGRRRHTSAIVNTETKIGRGTTAVDFNALPLNAVQRIEVLRDGAGALYGSDAIAGVVNIVLDESTGLDARLSYGSHVTHLEPVGDSLTDGESVTAEAKYGWSLDEGFFKVGGVFSTRDATNRAGFDQVPFFVAQTPDNLALRGLRNYAEGDPNVDELSLWFNGAMALGSSELYTFGTLGERESDGGAAFYRYPDGSSNVRAIYDRGFRPESRAEGTDVAAVVGLRGAAADWALDGSASFGRNRFAYGVDHSLNASLGAASPTSFDAGTYALRQSSLNLDARRELSGLAVPLVVAVGTEYRHEDYATRQGDAASFAAGPFDADIGAQAAPGLTPADEADLARDVRSVYAELGADLTAKLFGDAALRFEDYSDFGSAATGKLAARYELPAGLALRGAVSKSFRAPSIAQLGFADTSLNFGPNRTLVRTRTLRAGDPIAAALGAVELREEESANTSLGLVGIYDRLTFAVDVFRIDVDDRITLSERLFGQPIVDFLAAQPGGADVQSVRFFTNAVDTRTEGVDLTVSRVNELARGQLALTLTFHRADTDVERALATTPALAAVDPSLRLVGVEEINTLQDAAPSHKVIFTTQWTRDSWDLTLRLSRFGSAVRVFNFGGGFEPRQEYGAEHQLDVDFDYRLSETTAFRIGASNLFDEYPDLSSPDINFFGNLPYDILSPVGINGRFLYAEARWRR